MFDQVINRVEEIVDFGLGKLAAHPSRVLGVPCPTRRTKHFPVAIMA